jgi:uncharacterized membrane protein YcaP (DUF421 family)
MVESLGQVVDELLGLELDATDLEFRHMAWRTLVVFCCAVLFARVGSRRFLSHNAGFDIMVAILLGSVLSRGINGQANFFGTLGASALLVALHRLLATVAYHSHWFSQLVKGRAHVLVRDGKVDRDQQCRSKFTDDDLDESIRLHGNIADLREVAEARLERNGAVSVVKARPDRDVVASSPGDPAGGADRPIQ